MKLSIIIPAYNEEGRIKETLLKTAEYLSRQSFDWEILVINDGSKDGTAKIVEDLKSQINNLSLLDYKKNMGKGYAVRYGMLRAQGDYKLFMDADNSTKIDEIENFLPEFKKGFDVVIASRYVEGAKILKKQTFLRIILGGVFNLFSKFVVHGFSDTQCGFKVFSKECADKIFKKCKINGWIFDLEVLSLAQEFGCKIKEVPVAWENNFASKLKITNSPWILLDLVRVKFPYPLFLMAVAVIIHFMFLFYPSQIVFDEVYFGQFVNSYFTHQYYFDIHPPLGKLIIAFFVWLLHGQSSFDFSKIGNPAGNIFLMRFMPALAGTLFCLIIYFLARKMGLSQKAAFIAGFLVLFDNAILTQSKFILVDIFLLFFGFLSLYFIFCFKQKLSFIFWALAGISAVMAFSIKWTGLSFVAIVGICYLAFSFKKIKPAKILIWGLIVLAMSFAVYYLIFYVHFQLLNLSGPGNPYMSQEFDKNQLGPWDKFVELNYKMYFYNSNLKATHPYSSKWYQWPLDRRAIWYWTNTANGKIASIWLVGNPVVWLGVLAGMIACLVGLLFKEFRKKANPILYLLIFGYFLNLLPFIFVTRIAFLYHYLSALVFGILILAVLYDSFVKGTRQEFVFTSFLLFAVLIVFLIIAPITYGLPLGPGLNSFYGQLINRSI